MELSYQIKKSSYFGILEELEELFVFVLLLSFTNNLNNLIKILELYYYFMFQDVFYFPYYVPYLFNIHNLSYYQIIIIILSFYNNIIISIL